MCVRARAYKCLGCMRLNNKFYNQFATSGLLFYLFKFKIKIHILHTFSKEYFTEERNTMHI